MNEGEFGTLIVGLLAATIFWLAIAGADNDVLARHIETAEAKCELNEGVRSIEGHAMFSRFGFTATCNNGAEFPIRWSAPDTEYGS